LDFAGVAIVALISAEIVRDYLIALQDRWNTVMELFMSRMTGISIQIPTMRLLA
jgi:Ca2+/H+ antiporter